MKKYPSPPRRCIFCGGSPLSKEHLYADWMKGFLREGGPTEHVVTDMPVSNALMPRIAAGKLTLKGDHRARGLKVVCVTCNGGWMSRLQNEAKPLLVPWLNAKPRALTRGEQQTVAQWAVMFTMVYEFADTNTMAVPQHQRGVFHLERAIPPNWIVWIGRFSGFRRKGSSFHRGIALFESRETDVAVSDMGKAQFTFGAAGALFFATFYCSNDKVFSERAGTLSKAATALRFMRVWPTTGFSIRNVVIVDDDSFMTYMDHFSSLFIDHPYRLGGEPSGPRLARTSSTKRQARSCSTAR